MKRKLKEKLEKLGVYIVYLFGSKAIGEESRLSDIDIGVVFKDPPPVKENRFVYHTLYELFSELYPDSSLDIVFLQNAPLALQFFTIKDGKILFEKNPIFTADYENQVINQYLDFKPCLEFFNRVSKERYGEI